MVDTFNPSRLTLGRKLRGFTKKKLADQTEKTARTISLYERGDVVPPELAAASIASALRLPSAFFYRDEIDEPHPDGASFRGLASMTAAQRDMALACGALAMEIDLWVRDRFRLPNEDVPSMRGFEPEAAADALRAHWGLGEKPRFNTIHALEAHGVRVFSIPRSSRSVHAFSFWHNERPYALLTTDTSGEKGRFDAAHELGHLVLHRDGRIRGREAELEADRFASAFLMPRASVVSKAPIQPFLDNLIQLKQAWNVSLAALVHRLSRLGLLTEWQYRSLCVELAQRGFRRAEPHGIQRESSQVHEKVFSELRRRGISRSSIAKDLAIRVTDLDGLVFGLNVEQGAGGATGSPPPESRGNDRPKLRIV